MTQVTDAMILKGKPDVIPMIDGNSKPGRMKTICWPAAKFPGMKEPCALIEDGEDDPRVYNRYDDALRAANRILKKAKASRKATPDAKE